MKPYYSILFAGAALAVLSGCYFNVSSPSGWSDHDLKAVTNSVQSAGIPAGLKSLDVKNAFGAIHITGAPNGPFNWSQKLTVHARTDEVVQQLASNLVCRAELVGDRLTLVVTVPDSREPHNFQSDLEITVPKTVSVQLLDQYGGIEAANLGGEIVVKNRFGAVDLRDISGAVRADTSYAALKIGNTGPAALKNAFGAIEADGVHGALEAETSYAALEARDIGGAVKLRNQFGALRVEKAGDADLKTSYAEMRVREINGDAQLVNQFGRVVAEAGHRLRPGRNLLRRDGDHRAGRKLHLRQSIWRRHRAGCIPITDQPGSAHQLRHIGGAIARRTETRPSGAHQLRRHRIRLPGADEAAGAGSVCGRDARHTTDQPSKSERKNPRHQRVNLEPRGNS